jgi:serine/threonine-protein kinase RsbW
VSYVFALNPLTNFYTTDAIEVCCTEGLPVRINEQPPCAANYEPDMPSVDSSEEPLPEKDFDPDKLNLILRVTLSADRETVDPVVQEVMAVVRQMKGVDGKEDAIELALQEALANAVIHGAKEDPSKTVECLVSSDEERGVLIVVRDPGTGFSPESIPSCTVGENVYSNHGRGIFLINQLMDEVEFRKNGTEIRMVKR